MRHRRIIAVLSVLLLAVILAFILPGLTGENYQYFLSQRLPKVVAIILTGSAIAFSSVLFQTITSNRILTPAALGLDALYLLIQTVIVFTLGSVSLLVTDKNLNFVLTTVVMVALSMILFRIMLKRENTNLIQLVLVGMICGQLFRSFTSFLIMVINPNEFVAIQNKMFASFNSVNSGILMIAGCILFFAVIALRRDLPVYDVLALGRDHAIGLGIGYDRLVSRSLILISILVSVATALVGPVTFLGLLVANLARQLADTYKHSVVFMISILMSALFLLGGQLFVERVLNFETTVSVMINLVGGVYFIVLLIKESKL